MEDKEQLQLRLHYTVSVIGGFVGAYALLNRADLFGSAQTSNLIYIAGGLVGRDFAGLVLRIAALGIYISGIAAAVLIPKYTKINMHLLRLGLDGAVLVLLGFLPKEVNPFLALYPVFFVMALQWCAFKGAGGYVSSTIFSTNNLRQMTTALTEYLCDRKEEQLHKAGFFGKTLLFYHIGVGICFLATGPMGVKSAWICLLPVAAAAVQAAEECPVRESALADSLL